ncbi:MAG: hypothetical protein PVG71_14205 [Anaerolineae bacterium]|jgi:hypothetical protein
MSTPTTSVLVYGLYLVALGIVYMVVPNVPLRLFGFEPTTEPWIRVMAAMVVIVGYYYVQAARNRIRTFYRWTLHCRTFFPVFTVALVVAGLVRPMLLLFGAIDLAGALWTGLTLQSGSAGS